jgi:hypothetical protein
MEMGVRQKASLSVGASGQTIEVFYAIDLL